MKFVFVVSCIFLLIKSSNTKSSAKESIFGLLYFTKNNFIVLIKIGIFKNEVFINNNDVVSPNNDDPNNDYYSVFSLNGLQFQHGKNYVLTCAKKAGLQVQNIINSDFQYLQIGESHPGLIYSFIKID